ncbi:hypothetical protein CAEBREN_21567 [Caenorhabditis brenneri]|uniref:Uncharacterized protein n=1 Tax=Caenorhabditis brenneri TaxID=135651 RepID=G0NCC2_CAEBE|nr:hypothetical protein CAEBREN_21567 [Caenorhabditis brenneri]
MKKNEAKNKPKTEKWSLPRRIAAHLIIVEGFDLDQVERKLKEKNVQADMGTIQTFLEDKTANKTEFPAWTVADKLEILENGKVPLTTKFVNDTFSEHPKFCEEYDILIVKKTSNKDATFNMDITSNQEASTSGTTAIKKEIIKTETMKERIDNIMEDLKNLLHDLDSQSRSG